MEAVAAIVYGRFSTTGRDGELDRANADHGRIWGGRDRGLRDCPSRRDVRTSTGVGFEQCCGNYGRTKSRRRKTRAFGSCGLGGGEIQYGALLRRGRRFLAVLERDNRDLHA